MSVSPLLQQAEKSPAKPIPKKSGRGVHFGPRGFLRNDNDSTQTSIQKEDRMSLFKKIMWTSISIATLGIVREWHTFVLQWDDGDIEFLRGATVFEALDRAGYNNRDYLNHLEAWTTLEIWESENKEK